MSDTNDIDLERWLTKGQYDLLESIKEVRPSARNEFEGRALLEIAHLRRDLQRAREELENAANMLGRVRDEQGEKLPDAVTDGMRDVEQSTRETLNDI